MDNIRIGAAIRGLRQEHRLTQRQLADRLHVSAKTVSKWECGQGCPDPALWEALCACLGADLRKLLQGDLEPGRPDPGNMAKARFYVCPMCGNLLLGTGSCGVSCCGRSLTPLSHAADPEPLNLRVEEMDLDYYISWDHPMEKGHFLDFAAYVQDDRVLLIRLYPEQESAVRIPISRGDGVLYLHCTRHGLQRHRLSPPRAPSVTRRPRT